MKKSCFIQGIIVLTILTAAIVYIVKNHLNDFVLNPAKKEFGKVIMNEFDEKYKFVQNSAEKDSFRVLFGDYINIDKKGKMWSGDKIKKFFSIADNYLNDSLLTEKELTEIKKYAGTIK